MDLLSDPDLLPLLERSTEGELEISGGIGRLRIDLKQDDIRLWQDTLVTISTPGNLLLACEKGEVHLEATRLTWVVVQPSEPHRWRGPWRPAAYWKNLASTRIWFLLPGSTAQGLADESPGPSTSSAMAG